MKISVNDRKQILLIHFLTLALLLIPSVLFAHEPWLLTPQQIEHYNSLPRPLIFSTLTAFNTFVITSALFGVIAWVLLNRRFPETTPAISETRLSIALLLVRLGVGSSLILFSLGIIPRFGIPHHVASALFAPEFLLTTIPRFAQPIAYLSLIIGALFCLGCWIRIATTGLVFLMILCFSFFGIAFFQYAGFYTANVVLLWTLGSGKYSLVLTKPFERLASKALLPSQLLTGLNFMYSSYSIKWLQPNLDIGMLKTHQAFTFFMPPDYFTFLMMVTEFFFGILIMIGFRLPLISSVLILLFLFFKYQSVRKPVRT